MRDEQLITFSWPPAYLIAGAYLMMSQSVFISAGCIPLPSMTRMSVVCNASICPHLVLGRRDPVGLRDCSRQTDITVLKRKLVGSFYKTPFHITHNETHSDHTRTYALAHRQACTHTYGLVNHQFKASWPIYKMCFSWSVIRLGIIE